MIFTYSDTYYVYIYTDNFKSILFLIKILILQRTGLQRSL